jgi:hypothetical protein
VDAELRPPVKRGDLVSLDPGVRTVGIIDGVLLTDAAVGHREILTLMERGVTVIGGGSMGALRAAELKDLGMIGVGRIFKEYSSGRVDGDDEVVLAYDPFSLHGLSEPLINLRLNLEAAATRGVISDSDATRLIAELKRTFYPKRSYELLLSTARKLLGEEDFNRLSMFLQDCAIDFKRKDAILVLKAVKASSSFY